MKNKILNRILFLTVISVMVLPLPYTVSAQTFTPPTSNDDPIDGCSIGEVVVTGKKPTYTTNFSGFNPTPLDGATIPTINVTATAPAPVVTSDGNDDPIDGGSIGEVVVTGKKPTYTANFSGFNPTPLDGATIPTINVGNSYDGPSEEDGEEGTAGESYTMTSTVRTNDNGSINETTDSSSFTITDGGTGNGTDLSAAIANAGGNIVPDPTTTTINPSDVKIDNLPQPTTTTVKEEEDLSQYTGLYNGRQLLPDIMARHCRIKGEDVAKDVSLYVECIKQYVSEMNSSNAAAKAKAQEEFEILRYKGLLDMASNAMTKSQSVLNYENTMNEYNKADQDMQTEFDDNHALIATMSFITDVMNSFRELQAEQLKYLAISGIVNVDPAVVLADEEEEEPEEKKPASTNGNAGDAEIHTTEANTTIKHN